jgi:N-acetylglucosamine malate deacetylase 1
MKPTVKSRPNLPPLVAFGAHPDDIEFACGGVVAREALGGRRVHLVICSRGESASHGTPTSRRREAQRAAQALGATLEYVKLDGDATLEEKVAHAIKLAMVLRRLRPAIVLAPSITDNQHPDHPRLGRLVRDAARLARYGGMAALRRLPAHVIGSLFYYAGSTQAEPAGAMPVVIDISDPKVVETWTKAMECHASQLRTRNYVELQKARARVLGLEAGVEFAQALYPNDPPVFDSLQSLGWSMRRF